MTITAVPLYELAGVDSRSNPLNRPMRALHCRNWAPSESGVLELRYGYSTVTQSVVSNVAIHSMAEYRLWDQTAYLLYVQGLVIQRLAMASGTVTSLTPSLTSSARVETARSSNKLLLVNGTDQKIYDGTTLRDIGVQPVAPSQVANVTVVEVLRQPSPAESSTVTVTMNAGGSFGTTTFTGYQIYAHYLDTANGYGLGPGRSIGSRQTSTSGGKKFDLAILPNLSTVNANWVKVFSVTGDGTGIAKLCASTSKAVTNLVYGSGVVTLTAAAHGFSTGDVVEVNVLGWEYVAAITVIDVNTFTYKDLYHRSDASATVTGTVYKLVVAANAATTASITSTATGNLTANADSIGLAASTVGGAQPGYKLYVSAYNVTEDHPGNRYAIPGDRVKPATAGTRAIFYVQGLSVLPNTEEAYLAGRTGDGAEVPYIVADSALNWQYIDHAGTSFLLRDGGIDGDSEMPTQNDVPVGLAQLARVGDRLYGRQLASPYVFFTPDGGNLGRVGKIEHSWFADDFETFPTDENTVCIAEFDHELVVFSLNNVAILSEISGIQAWRGPWNLGAAGARSFIQCPHGAFWVTGDKQLARISAEGPVVISSEYEKALLSKIDDVYLSTTEITYLKDASRGIDQLKIKGRDVNGNPVEIRHDFKLRDARSPEGQGYDAVYVGPLASDYTMRQVRDSDSVMRVWFGASDGNLYQAETYGNDAGNEFTAQYVGLVNAGEEKKSLPRLEFWGDKNLKVLHNPNLNCAGYSELNELRRQDIPLGPNDFHYRVTRTAVKVDSPEYFALELTSHPADVDLTNPMVLSDVPHLPVEDYGRVYGVKVMLADGEGQ